MNCGEILLVKYNLPGNLYHERIVVCADPAQNGSWYIVTPEGDLYSKDYRPGGDDVADLKLLPYLGAECREIGAARVHRFSHAMSDGEFGGLVRTTLARLGLARPLTEPILCRDSVSYARARAVAEGAAIGASSSTDNVWVSMETRGSHRKGDIIELSSDAVVLEDRAMSKSMGVWVTVAWCARSEASEMSGEDMRTLPVRIDSQGRRHRDFKDSVALMTDIPVAGTEGLEGPRSGLWLAKNSNSFGGGFYQNHLLWVRDSGVSTSDRSIYEGEAISRALDCMVMTDQLNCPVLDSYELLCRRLQLIRTAHATNPAAPDYSMSDIVMGLGQSKLGVSPSLSKYMAEELKARAAVAKEVRKTKEERDQGKGGKGAGKKGDKKEES
eukprot:3552436-Amphidinium_carterae.2